MKDLANFSGYRYTYAGLNNSHDIRFERVWRIPPLAKSMIAIAHKP